MIRRVRADELAPTSSMRASSDAVSGEREVGGEEALVQAAMSTLFAEQHALAPEAIVRLVERELRRFQGAHDVTLRVHPDDAARLPAPQLLARTSALPAAPTVLVDAALTPGGCMLTGFETETGEVEVDARVETRIARALAFARGALP